MSQTNYPVLIELGSVSRQTRGTLRVCCGRIAHVAHFGSSAPNQTLLTRTQAFIRATDSDLPAECEPQSCVDANIPLVDGVQRRD